MSEATLTRAGRAAGLLAVASWKPAVSGSASSGGSDAAQPPPVGEPVTRERFSRATWSPVEGLRNDVPTCSTGSGFNTPARTRALQSVQVRPSHVPGVLEHEPQVRVCKIKGHIPQMYLNMLCVMIIRRLY